MYTNELETAKRAARKAAELVRSFDGNRSDLHIRQKEKFDLVTDADMASEEIIRSIILETFPDDVFVGEETSLLHIDGSGRRWIVDPIDGTTNFAHGFPPYCISIALYDGFEPLVGVVLEVARNEMFHAIKGQGAYLNDVRISVSQLEEPSNALFGTGFPVNEGMDYTSLLELAEVILVETQGLRRAGSAAYDLCSVAAGRLDGYYEIGLQPWDVAAGALLVSEAGGHVTDMNGGTNWLLGKQILVGGASMHRWLKKAIYTAAPELTL